MKQRHLIQANIFQINLGEKLTVFIKIAIIKLRV